MILEVNRESYTMIESRYSPFIYIYIYIYIEVHKCSCYKYVIDSKVIQRTSNKVWMKKCINTNLRK